MSGDRDCANPGHAVGKVDPRTIPEYAYDDSWCHECQEILKKVHMIQKHFEKHGNQAWEGVEKFRINHGHLPGEEDAPCRQCFNERTAALLEVKAIRSRCENLEKAAKLSEEALERFGALSDPSGKGRELWRKYGGPTVGFIQSILSHPDVSQEKGEETR